MEKQKVSIIIGCLCTVIVLMIAGFFFFPKTSNQIKVEDTPPDLRYSKEDTGINLIQKALDEKKIDLNMALIYKVKFLFNDPTLPKEYFTENAPFEDGGTFAEVQENWDKLLPETKKTLEPYFLRPDNPESFISKMMNGEIKTPETGWFDLLGQSHAFERPIAYKTDDSLNTSDGKIKVWYPEKKEIVNGKEKITKLFYGTAQKIVANLNKDQAYAQYVSLLGKVPPSDETLGGDSKLDIYVGPVNYSLLLDGKGVSSQGVNAPDGPIHGSSFIIIRENLNEKHLKTTTVHEIFHAFQRVFKCQFTNANLWWTEASATWSEDFIYPTDDTEQEYVESFIPKPSKSLFKNKDNFEYGAYVFPFFLSKTYDNTIVTKIFEGCKTSGSALESINKTIDGGFKRNWKEFTLWNYNKQPVENYKKADKSKKFTSHTSQTDNSDMVFLAPPKTPLTTKELKPLTSQVIETFFSETYSVRKATFTNLKNFTDKADGAAIKAVIYPKKGEPYIEDWTDLEKRSFCFDKEKEDFDKVILIFSNAELKNKIDASTLQVETKDSCYEISQGETMTVKPIFAVTPEYVGTLRYEANGELVKDSVPNNAKYPYLGKWKVKIDYLEKFPEQTVYGITSSKMDYSYNHYLEFDLTTESVLKEGTFNAETKEGKFQTPGWDITNLISGESVNIPANNTMWSVPKKGKITEMTENGCKISLPDFVLYNSGGYRDLPKPIIFEIKY